MRVNSLDNVLQVSRLPNSFVPFREHQIEQSIPTRFEAQVANYPYNVAIRVRDQVVTYEELNRLANRVAWSILDTCGDTNEPVGVLLPQGPHLVATILGVLKAGKAYVAQDPLHLPEGIEHAFSDVQVTALLTDQEHATLASNVVRNRCPVLVTSDMMAAGSVENPDLSFTPEKLAYIFYTSGSTGRAKAVADTHRNVLHNIMRYTNTLQIGSDDRLSLLQSASFSGSVSSMFCALLNGATLCPYDVRAEGLGHALADWLNRERITIFHSVPVIFRSLGVTNVRFPAVRVIRLEGDAAAKQDVQLYRDRFEPDCVLVNGLGTTETGICRQFFVGKETAIEGNTVPVGYAVKDMEVLVLDDEGHEVSGPNIGEIAVRSKYLAAMYWRNSELTNKAFLSDPAGGDIRIYRTGDLGRMHADGCLDHLGRKDFHRKVRGQWVNVAEIEATIGDAIQLKDVVVATVNATGQAEARLVAYLVPGEEPVPPAPVLRTMLKSLLSPHMVPTAFVTLDMLPLDQNGKVDRRMLPCPDQGRPGHLPAPVLPRDDLERELTSVWEEALGIMPIGVHDNFFDLGGDSLAELTIQSALDARGIMQLPDSLSVPTSSISQLAEYIAAGPNLPAAPAIVALRRSGLNPPLFCVPDWTGAVAGFGTLARHLGDDQPVYALSLVPGKLEDTPTTIEQLAARHVTAMRSVQPTGPYHIAGLCFGAVVALEIAHQLLSCGERVALLSFMNITAYDFPHLVSDQARHHYRFAVLSKLRFVYQKPDRWTSLGSKIRRSAKNLRWNLQRKLEHRLGLQWSRDSAARARNVLQSAFEAYVPRPYPGHVTIFLAELGTLLYSNNPGEDWEGLATDGVTVHILPRDGQSMLNESDVVQDLAARLRACLDTAGNGAIAQ